MAHLGLSFDDAAAHLRAAFGDACRGVFDVAVGAGCWTATVVVDGAVPTAHADQALLLRHHDDAPLWRSFIASCCDEADCQVVALELGYIEPRS